MFKKISKHIYFNFIPFTILGLLTIVLFVMGIIPLNYLWFTFIGWILIAGLGIEVGYHRIFSHRNYRNLPKWKENIILFFGSLGSQGSSITWVAIHRQHHRYADKELDLHSPKIHNKWYAFAGWLHDITESNNSINFKYASDLIKKPNHLWFHKYQLFLLWIVPLIIALFNWKLALALIVLPSTISLIVNNLINVLVHDDFPGNYRNYDTNDASQNNAIFGLLSWGLGLHNNHHHDPRNFSTARKWWELDPCVIFKIFLK